MSKYFETMLITTVGGKSTTVKAYKKLRVKDRLDIGNQVRRSLMDPSFTPTFPFEVEYFTKTVAPIKQVVPEQVVPEQVVPEQVVPEQVVPEQVVPEQVVPEPENSMKTSELYTAIKEFQEEKENMHWMDFAPIVIKAIESGDIAFYSVTDPHPRTSRKRIQEMVVAYRFLAMRRPDAVKPPHPDIFIGTVRYLPTVYGRMSGDDKEERFEKLIDDVLTRVVSYNDIQNLAKALNSRTQKEPPHEAVENKPLPEVTNNEIQEAFVNSMRTTMILLKMAVKEVGYTSLRENAKECDDLATQLNCIADADYLRMWNERKEFSL